MWGPLRRSFGWRSTQTVTPKDLQSSSDGLLGRQDGLVSFRLSQPVIFSRALVKGRYCGLDGVPFSGVGVSGCVQQAEKDPSCCWAGRVVILWVGVAAVRRIGIVAAGEVQG